MLPPQYSARWTLISDKQQRERMARAGKALCEAHRGATQRHLEVLKALVRG